MPKWPEMDHIRAIDGRFAVRSNDHDRVLRGWCQLYVEYYAKRRDIFSRNSNHQLTISWIESSPHINLLEHSHLRARDLTELTSGKLFKL